MESDIGHLRTSLTSPQYLVEELADLVIEAFQNEISLAETQRHGEAILEGRGRLEMMRIAKDNLDKVIEYLPLWQEAFARATAVLMARNNERLLALIYHKE